MKKATKKSILITGGARSGKSELAERVTLKATGRGVYIATAQAFDDEMRARIKTHQERRGPAWEDHHAPLDLAEINSHASTNEPGAFGLLLATPDGVIAHSEDVGFSKSTHAGYGG